ncbi:MAG: hypothetical protein EZS28_003661 [Streblomastix strix]|uniref:Myb-like domain-containing protein n=1 Tax=Streblomastix strix TaxID=222440 RepID=A0A5J4X0Z0_9EUKA|nr:MAG: hypothetical protein EZS28_003661 [Streblomastix strix]
MRPMKIPTIRATNQNPTIKIEDDNVVNSQANHEKIQVVKKPADVITPHSSSHNHAANINPPPFDSPTTSNIQNQLGALQQSKVRLQNAGIVSIGYGILPSSKPAAVHQQEQQSDDSDKDATDARDDMNEDIEANADQQRQTAVVVTQRKKRDKWTPDQDQMLLNAYTTHKGKWEKMHKDQQFRDLNKTASQMKDRVRSITQGKLDNDLKEQFIAQKQQIDTDSAQK